MDRCEKLMSLDYTSACVIDARYDFVDYYDCVNYVYDMDAIGTTDDYGNLTLHLVLQMGTEMSDFVHCVDVHCEIVGFICRRYTGVTTLRVMRLS